MKQILLNALFSLIVFNCLAQNKLPKPKSAGPEQLIRIEVIKTKKSELALPQYYKTERLDVKLISKPSVYYRYEGLDEIPLTDTSKLGKYLFLLGFEEYDQIQPQTLYFIKSREIEYITTGFVKVIFQLQDSSENVLEVFYYLEYDKETNRTEEALDASKYYRTYSKTRKVKGTIPSVYEVNHYYRAMSNGGTTRIYHETGRAIINPNGKAVFLRDEDED